MRRDHTLYLFDLDGTLIEAYMDDAEKRFERVVWLPGRLEKLQALTAAGASFGIVSNQAGVAFGYVTEQQVSEKLRQVHADLIENETIPVMIAACLTHPEATMARFKKADPRRKPNPGMLREVMDAADPVHLGGPTVMVGDREEDRLAAAGAGVLFQDAEVFFAPAPATASPGA
jgi:D-glycero-D-manno-heptose 1,7-bisphosphate phosphatase